MKILIKREAARGDVLVASAVVPALREKYENTSFAFYTKCPEVLMRNIYIDYVSNDSSILEEKFDKIIDLDLAYEKKPNTHILQSYADVASVEVADCKLYMYCAPVNMPLFQKYVVIHNGVTNWVGRHWDYTEIALRLHKAGYQVVCIGSGDDKFVPCDADVRNRASINQVATIIKHAKLFIGIDSLPMHIAQAVGTPGVVFFGSIAPELRIIKDITPVMVPDLHCLGCHHRRPAPSVVTNVCETGTLDCVNKFTDDMMWQKVWSCLNKL